MDEPITFVVETRHGVECPSVIVGKLPDRRITARVRLDQLANAEVLLKLSVRQLHALYKAGALA